MKHSVQLMHCKVGLKYLLEPVKLVNEWIMIFEPPKIITPCVNMSEGSETAIWMAIKKKPEKVELHGPLQGDQATKQGYGVPPWKRATKYWLVKAQSGTTTTNGTEKFVRRNSFLIQYIAPPSHPPPSPSASTPSHIRGSAHRLPRSVQDYAYATRYYLDIYKHKIFLS